MRRDYWYCDKRDSECGMKVPENSTPGSQSGDQRTQPVRGTIHPCRVTTVGTPGVAAFGSRKSAWAAVGFASCGQVEGGGGFPYWREPGGESPPASTSCRSSGIAFCTPV